MPTGAGSVAEALPDLEGLKKPIVARLELRRVSDGRKTGERPKECLLFVEIARTPRLGLTNASCERRFESEIIRYSKRTRKQLERSPTLTPKPIHRLRLRGFCSVSSTIWTRQPASQPAEAP